MADTNLRQVIFSCLIFTALIAGMFMMVSYTLPSDTGNFTNYNRSINKFNEIKEEAETAAYRMDNPEPKTGIDGLLTGLYDITFGAVNQMWNAVKTMFAIIGDFSTGNIPLPIPSWFTGLLTVIILVTVSLAIIASIRKWYI